ncbi:MAG: hypothetical protein ACOYXT_22090, partial [Bacteroidota bacterium]
MGKVVIVVYKPKKGKENLLLDVVRDHLPVLRAQGLVTDRKPIVARAADGAIIEVFEWKSADAIDKAHSNPEVQRLWGRFSEACDYTRPIDVK